MTARWRAGGGCPIDGCNFEIYTATDDEVELDLVVQAAMQAHSDRSHGGAPATVQSYRGNPQPRTDEGDDEQTEERPRLLN